MFRRSLRICCFLSTFLVSGCGGIEQTLDKSIGKNPYHEFACGPCSLSDYQEIYHEWTPCWDVSHNIIKHQHLAGFIIRDIAGLFNIDMKRITLPSEMIEYLNREGFAVRIFRGNPQECKKYVEKLIQNKQSGITLSENGFCPVLQHYEAFPPLENVGRLYGKRNRILMVFVINDTGKRATFPSTQPLIQDNEEDWDSD